MLCALIGGFCERASDKNEITASASRASLSLNLSVVRARARASHSCIVRAYRRKKLAIGEHFSAPGSLSLRRKLVNHPRYNLLREGPRLSTEGGRSRAFRPLRSTRRPETVMKRNASNRIILRPVAFLINPNGRKSVRGWHRGRGDVCVADAR